MDHYATGYAVDDGESDAVGDGVYDAASDAVYDAVGDAVGDAVEDVVSDAVRDAVCDAVDSTVCDDIEDALKDCNTLELSAVLASQRAAAARCGRFGSGGRLSARRRVPMYRGSVKGRRANKQREFPVGVYNIRRDYFGINGRPPVYDERDFERRFRVPRDVFLRVYDAVKEEPGFKQSVNATGQAQAHPLEKAVAAFRVIANGEAYDRADEYVRLSRSTIATYTKKLIYFKVERFGPSYLRKPTDAEVSVILARNEQRGMPGCLGSIDCSQWKWSACPKGLHDQFQSRKKGRSIVIEAVFDEDLWIWHWFVGAPGSYNDVNVLGGSPLFDAVQAGKWPPDNHRFTVNGRERDMLHYLADGIYLRYPFLATPCPVPTLPKHKVFNRLQGALRKDVEHLFGVITGRFHIALHLGRYRSVPQLNTTSRSVATLHNMVVEVRHKGFDARRRTAAAGVVIAERADLVAHVSCTLDGQEPAQAPVNSLTVEGGSGWPAQEAPLAVTSGDGTPFPLTMDPGGAGESV